MIIIFILISLLILYWCITSHESFLSCLTGWYADGNKCIQVCSNNSQSRNPDGSCICGKNEPNKSCFAPFTCVNNSCVQPPTCPTGWFADGNKCVQICSNNSQVRNADGSCICGKDEPNKSCYSSFTCVNNMCVSPPTCPNGWYPYDNKCYQICSNNSQARNADGSCICGKDEPNKSCYSLFTCVNHSCTLSSNKSKGESDELDQHTKGETHVNSYQDCGKCCHNKHQTKNSCWYYGLSNEKKYCSCVSKENTTQNDCIKCCNEKAAHKCYRYGLVKDKVTQFFCDCPRFIKN